MVAMLSRLMPNIPGPRSSKRRAMMSVAHSIMLYGAEVWASALRVDTHRRKLASVQRRAALRVACAYRTVSEAAVLVVAGIIPIDILATERKRVFEDSSGDDRAAIRSRERTRSLQQWQERWRSASTGRWTARLIREVTPWSGRKHGEVTFYLTQFLTGHGHFNAYLFKLRRKGSPHCDYCTNEEDDVAHTFFRCGRWETQRRALQSTVHTTFTPETTAAIMLHSPSEWDAVASFVEAVLRRKKTEERERERDAEPPHPVRGREE